MTDTNPFSKYYGFTGERLVKAKRIFLVDAIVGVMLAFVVAFLGILFPNNGFNFLIFIAVLVGLTIYRLARSETYFQLRMQEVKATRHKANAALKDLHEFAGKLKNSGRGRG